jgi:hypothetical protein
VISWSTRLARAEALRKSSAAFDVTDLAKTARGAVMRGTADHRMD